MQTWIALFRGINVGGKNRLPMKDLTAALTSLGCEEVRTYIQSGNAVFRSPQKKGAELANAISGQIESQHGFTPQVILLTLKQFEQALSANPFPEAETEPKSVHLFFLSAKPKSPDIDGMKDIQSDSERFELIGNVFYLHAPDGVGRSKLASRCERLIGVPATARNWRSVQRIAEMAGEI